MAGRDVLLRGDFPWNSRSILFAHDREQSIPILRERKFHDSWLSDQARSLSGPSVQ